MTGALVEEFEHAGLLVQIYGESDAPEAGCFRYQVDGATGGEAETLAAARADAGEMAERLLLARANCHFHESESSLFLYGFGPDDRWTRDGINCLRAEVETAWLVEAQPVGARSSESVVGAFAALLYTYDDPAEPPNPDSIEDDLWGDWRVYPPGEVGHDEHGWFVRVEADTPTAVEVEPLDGGPAFVGLATGFRRYVARVAASSDTGTAAA